MNAYRKTVLAFGLFAVTTLGACSSSDEATGSAQVRIKNDFDNPAMSYNPPWTICHAFYQGAEFGKIAIGETSPEKEVAAGLDYVVMVAAWKDPDCKPENCLPIASKNKEEVVSGQARTIAINLPNHQGSCPPEGVAPIPEEQYEKIRALWPEYNFKPYAQRTENPECQGSGDSSKGEKSP